MIETKNTLKSFILSELAGDGKIKNLGDEESVLERGMVDSIGMVKLLMFIEETYGIKIEDEELVPENFETISAMCRLIEPRIALLSN